MHDRVEHEVRHQLRQQRGGAEHRGRGTAHLHGDAATVGERHQRLDRSFREERQIHDLAGERATVRPAEQQQRFGEFDRAGVDLLQAGDQRIDVAMRGWMLRDGGRRRCSKPSAPSC
ncbi:hypothetical protein [Microbacterium maritypicum]|uniref:hypothetical protein n=1 Tax=Microbacterium maritypicum TaxID=33918 RepID=UPI002FD7F8E1